MSDDKSPAPPRTESRSRAVFLVWAVLLPLALMIAGVALAHFDAIAPMQGFLIYLVAGLVSVVHAALLLLMRFVLKNKPQWRIVAATAVPFLVVIASASTGIGYPPINDISTDFDAPPQFDAVAALPENSGRDMAFPPKFADEIRKAYPQLASYSAAGSPTTRTGLFDAALALAKSQTGWTIVRTNSNEGIIEGTAKSWLFRFRDDFVIRVSEKDGKVLLDMRSKSRDGKGDLGANAKRIESFIRKVQTSIGTT